MFKGDDVVTIEEHLPHTHFSHDDAPHLSIARYSLSPDYEPRDVDDKKLVDLHGATDNLFWYRQNQQQRNDEL